jgi:hypothetical protein
MRRKRVLSTLPISNPLLNKNPLKQPYQAQGGCFSPYNAFLSLYTLWGNSVLSKPDDCFALTSSSKNPFKKALFTSIWYNLNPLAKEKARRILITSKRDTGVRTRSVPVVDG